MEEQTGQNEQRQNEKTLCASDTDLAALKRELAVLRVKSKQSTVERTRIQFAAFALSLVVFALSFKADTSEDGKQHFSWNLDGNVLSGLVAAITAMVTGVTAITNIKGDGAVDPAHVDDELTKF